MAFRSTDLLMFRWFHHMGLDSLIFSFRDSVHGMKEMLPVWVMYNFPDGCWVWSVTSACVWIWKRVDSWESGLWIASSMCLGVLSEIAQHYRIISGVADGYDALCMIIAGMGAYFTCRE